MAQTRDIVAIKTEAGADEPYIGDLISVVADNKSSKHFVLRVPAGVELTIQNIDNTKTVTIVNTIIEAKQVSEAYPITEVVVYDLWRLVKEPKYRVKVSDKILTLRQTLSIDGKDLNDLHSFGHCCIRNGDAIKLYVTI